MKLPLYIIEHVLGKWVLYNTETTVCLEFDTRAEAEAHLKTLTETKTN